MLAEEDIREMGALGGVAKRRDSLGDPTSLGDPASLGDPVSLGDPGTDLCTGSRSSGVFLWDSVLEVMETLSDSVII